MEKEIICRLCKNKVKGEALYAVHKSLCVGPGSSYSVILSNVNNYERPGRERYSQHHRYRPSEGRPCRSKSVQPKGNRGGTHAANTGASLACHCHSRVGIPAARYKRRMFRSKSVPPPGVNGRVKSGARSRRRLLSGTRKLDGSPDKVDECAITSQNDTAIRNPNDCRDPSLFDATWERAPIVTRSRSKSVSTTEDDGSFYQRKNCASPSSLKTNLSTGQSSPTSSVMDLAEKTRLGISDYKPFFFDSESVPPSFEVARRRSHGGRRGYFCCEIGCSCRKCHYFSLSLASGRQSPFLRRCDADCPCAKCHLPGKVPSSSSPGRSPSFPRLKTTKKLASSSSAMLKEHRSNTSASPRRTGTHTGGVPHWSTPKSVRRRFHGRRRGAASCQSGDERSKERKNLSETESPSPRRRREKKEVCYQCGPCGMDLYSWYSIRKHLMSSEHLQTVKYQRKQANALKGNRMRRTACNNAAVGETLESTARNVNSEPENPKDRLMAGLNLVKVIATGEDKDETLESSNTALDKSCGVPLEPVAVPEAIGLIEGACGNAHLWPVDEGNVMRTSTSIVNLSPQSSSVECNLQNFTSDCPDNASVTAREIINVVPSPMKLMLHQLAQLKANHLRESQKSTFVRIEYKKKVPMSSHHHPSGSKASISVSEERQRASLRPRLHPSNLPTPFVDLGERCDSEGWAKGLGSKRSHDAAEEPPKKMIRMDYQKKTSRPASLSCTSSSGSLTYLSPSVSGDKEDSRCPSPLSSVKSLVDEEALGERLFLYDSEPEDSKVLRDFGMQTPDESGEQIFMLDGQKFLSRLIGRLNDGGLCCQSCGSKMDGNSIVSQLYNCVGKMQPQGRLNDNEG